MLSLFHVSASSWLPPHSLTLHELSRSHEICLATLEVTLRMFGAVNLHRSRKPRVLAVFENENLNTHLNL